MQRKEDFIAGSKKFWGEIKHLLNDEQLWQIVKENQRLVGAWALEELAERGDKRKNNG